jgi:HK97 family phage prohead protease
MNQDTAPEVKLFSRFSLVEKAEGDDDGFVYIEGYASTGDLDRHNDVIPPNVWNKQALKAYKKNPIVLFAHRHAEPIGTTIEMTVDEKGLLIKAKIDADDPIGQKIKKGILKTFSVGFSLKDYEYNPTIGAWLIKELELFEISVVSIPANGEATFSLAKQLGGEENVKALLNKLKGKATMADTTKEKEVSWFEKMFGSKTEADATKSLEDLAKEKAATEAEKAKLAAEKAALEAEKATLAAEKAALEKALQTEKAEKATLLEQKTALETAKTAVETEKATLLEEKTALETEKATLEAAIAKAKGIKKVAKGNDPDVSGKEKKETPNESAAQKNLAFLKNR